MKGFMFSIEAVIAISAVLLTLGATAFIAEQKQVSDNYGQIRAQSEVSRALYSNMPGINPSPTSKEEYCEKIIYYDKTNDAFGEKNFCLVIK